MKKSLAICTLFLLPMVVLGVYPEVARGAGFAKQSLFLSKTPVQEGESVRIHAVVANDATTAFKGSVVFKDGDSKIGSVAVTIAASGANTVSLAWRPSAGSHTIAAELTNSGGTIVEKESAVFSINAKPVAPALKAPEAQGGQSAATVESSENIQKQIGSLYPPAQQVSKPAFTVIDGFRSSAADVLDSQLAKTKEKLAATPKSGIVAGALTEDPKIENPWGNFWMVLYTLYIYLLTVLRFIIGNAGVFYPLLAVAFFYLLWRSYKRFRSPRYA